MVMTEPLTFIDLFAGIGGFRAGFEKAGMKCLGYVEIDKFARKSYEAMYDTTGEWTAHDIRLVRPGEIPKAGLWCFGFPCQDISVAGKQQGLGGSRSSLFYSVINILKQLEETGKPRWLVIENVKNLLSINQGWDFATVLSEISEAGYDAEWAVLNSKNFNVPQNRERVFIIGHIRNGSGQFILSQSRKSGQADSEIQVNKILNSTQHFSVVAGDGLAPTVAACDYKDPQKVAIKTMVRGNFQTEDIVSINGLSKSETASQYKNPHKVAIPCMTPDRINKRQNGRRFKNEEEPMFTLTTQDKHGVLLFDGNEYYIRRLTPKECFRLQGFTDEQFNKAASVNSNTQLYKQAGNAVTVNVAEWIGKRIVEVENGNNI